MIRNSSRGKPFFYRNGLGVRKSLKTKEKLQAHKHINKYSDKQKEKLKSWKQVTEEKIKDLNNICQWCGTYGTRYGYPNPLTGHHIIKRRFNDHTKGNCYVCHWFCHQFIEDHSINVAIFHNKSEWEKRDVSKG